MEGDEIPSRYPYLISVRGSRPVPARREGRFYVCAYQVLPGLWWAPREVRVLEYDPQRDFYREQLKARESAHRESVGGTVSAAPDRCTTPTPDAAADTPVREQVDTHGPRRPAPPTGRSAPQGPRRAWGR